jgi:hypothetical protein
MLYFMSALDHLTNAGSYILGFENHGRATIFGAQSRCVCLTLSELVGYEGFADFLVMHRVRLHRLNNEGSSPGGGGIIDGFRAATRFN